MAQMNSNNAEYCFTLVLCFVGLTTLHIDKEQELGHITDKVIRQGCKLHGDVFWQRKLQPKMFNKKVTL